MPSVVVPCEDADDDVVHVRRRRRTRCRRRPSSPGRRSTSAAGTSPHSSPSRPAVQVVLRTSTSISPDCRAVKRSSAATSTNSTLVASPSTAAAMTRQKSASKPTCSPAASTVAKPGEVVARAAAHDVVAITVSSIDSPVCTSSAVPVPGVVASVPAGAHGAVVRSTRSSSAVRPVSSGSASSSSSLVQPTPIRATAAANGATVRMKLRRMGSSPTSTELFRPLAADLSRGTARRERGARGPRWRARSAVSSAAVTA